MPAIYPGPTKPFNASDTKNVSYRPILLYRQLDYVFATLYIVYAPILIFPTEIQDFPSGLTNQSSKYLRFRKKVYKIILS